ncbi:MAG: twin-arginine translocation signal domain-containing protein, partial [Hydrogenovibrio crunogenus]|nr:twin-arginine translocation signal domain-containing protein [Hydrogenovibrio crunogenus]
MAPDGNDTKDLRTMFADNPEAADLKVFGREVHADRRGFLRGAGLAAMSAAVGMTIPFHRNIPQGFIPAAMAQDNILMGKDGLTLLNDRPLNAETPPELLDDAITPTSRHFIRNNGLPPEDTSAENWTLTIDGFVDNPMELSIADLRDQF